MKWVGRFALFTLSIAASVIAIAAGTNSELLGLPKVFIRDTPAQIALGRSLFMDRRLSPNGTMSCAMCHVPEQGFTVNEIATAVGMEGKSLRRNAPSLLNTALNATFFHDGRAKSLEEQVWGPLLAADEMANGTKEAVVNRIRELADYRSRFDTAFPDRGITPETIGLAIAAYERSLLSAGSRFDRWRFNDETDALTAQEKAGFEVFAGKGKCIACHRLDVDSALFNDGGFHNTGIGAHREKPLPASMPVQIAPGQVIEFDTSALKHFGEIRPKDDGRFEVTQVETDRLAYRTPTLRNVALTAPYMHDGSLPTLAAVVDFYDKGGGEHPLKDWRLTKLNLTEAEKAALVAFLHTLTGSNVERLAKEARAAFPGETFDPLRPVR